MIKASVTGSPSGKPPSNWQIKITEIFGTGFGTGYAPGAQGTLGSMLFTLLAWFFWPKRCANQWKAALFINTLSIPVSFWGERLWGKDPGRITIDEFAGQAIALTGIPRTIKHFILALLLFRLFDVSKPGIVKRFESLPGGWGITLDDTAAGILARLVHFAITGK